jgi:hypothetical protein
VLTNRRTAALDALRHGLHIQLVIPREGGGSSTPRLHGSITLVSGMLGRPIKSGDDSCREGATSLANIFSEAISRLGIVIDLSFDAAQCGVGKGRPVVVPAAAV